MKKTHKTKKNPYCLDKLAITLDTDILYHARIKKRLIRLMRGKSRFTLKTGIRVYCYPSSLSGLKKHYSENFLIKIWVGFSQIALLISTHPKSNKVNFLRIEFNPNHAAAIGSRKIRKLLLYICGRETIANLYSKGKVTRADICVDSPIDMGNTFPYVPGMALSVIYRDSEGTIQTFTIGGWKIRFCIYDNIAEHMYRTGEEGSPNPSFRLELQTRTRGVRLRELHPRKYLAALSKVEFYSDDFLDDEYFTDSFLWKAEEFGLNHALAGLDRSTRASFVRRLRRYHKEECPFDLSEILRKDFRRVLKIFKFREKT